MLLIDETAYGKEAIVLGDFNLPSLRGNDEDETRPTPVDAKFLDAFQRNGLYQLVESPTHSLGSILDLILASRREILVNLEILSPMPDCDHFPILVSILFRTTMEKELETWKLNWAEGDYQQVSTAINSYDWDLVLYMLDANQRYNRLREIFTSLLYFYVPLMKETKHNPAIQSCVNLKNA